jgi:hypothetical protein
LTVILIVVGIGIVARVFRDDPKNPHDTKSAVFPGVDPHAYVDMATLYGAGPRAHALAPTDQARLDAPTLGRCFDVAIVPASPECARRLALLDPARGSDEVQTAIRSWAKEAAGTIRAKNASLTTGALREAEGKYKSGNYEEAATSYADLLDQAPAHLDARNNYALVQLHLGHDVVAQLELEILRLLDSSYVPAMVNLTVLYERAWPGDSARASALAEAAVKSGPNVEPAMFNAAWYRQRIGRGSESRTLLAPLVAAEREKAMALDRMNSNSY